MNFEAILEALSGIARRAGDAILDIYNNPALQAVESKADNSPLTLADKAANKVICDGLKALAVQYPIISEENKAVPYEVRKEYVRYWLVDPLDGTKEFIKRNGEFTVNIALIEGGMPILGVVYAPCLDELYTAANGLGAHLYKGGTRTRLSANSFGMDDAGLCVVCSRSHMSDETKAFVDKLNTPDMVSRGSSLKFLLLASGAAHVYPRLAPTMEWDTAAAQIVLEQAGGRVVRADDNTPLAYNKENMLNPYFIAYGNVQG
jgi:3'(2'), 5'-bisphosphate nucleotidase